MRWRPLNALPLAFALLGGCASLVSWNPDAYVVQRGDTLYAIAWRHNLDPQQLARWNQLGSGNLIFPGQEIRLSPPDGWQAPAAPAGPKPSARNPRQNSPARVQTRPAPAPADAPADWVWPTDGRLASRFGEGDLGGKGVDIRGREGQPILAASGGEVVYSGSGLIGYGQLIIIKHNDAFLSAYGYNRKLSVKEGDRVRGGQEIAQMGTGPGKEPAVHFEIRLHGKPVDPLRYLPAR
jgi:lipoprotein NlpD